MASRDWTSGRRILGAWLLIVLVASVGWLAGRVYADRYVEGLDRDVICANTGVALGDTLLRRVERARSDSIATAERNCASRYQLARQGRESMVYIPLAIVAGRLWGYVAVFVVTAFVNVAFGIAGWWWNRRTIASLRPPHG